MAIKGKPTSKRPAPVQQGSRKRQKSTKTKRHAFERDTIPIPGANEDDGDDNFSDQDLDVLQTAGFLHNLNVKEISLSKSETQRLHALDKPPRPKRVKDDLPSVDSHDEDYSSWSSGIDEESESESDSDAEMPYEAVPRKVLSDNKVEVKKKGIQRLPIKLSDGRVIKTGETVVPLIDDEEETDSKTESFHEEEPPAVVDDVSTGARFGRLAVLDVITTKARSERLRVAKQQIASISQDIIADPQSSIGLLRRLHTFALDEVASATHPEPVKNDVAIRKLAVLSQLAVFKDIIPGYRIRQLSDKEKAEKVSQMVQQTREYEEGLVGAYQEYLKLLETELKVKGELAETALRCICRLLIEATHFNFRVNLIAAVVARLSKKSWDEVSELCFNTLITVFRADHGGEVSLEAVRLLNRMIKERRFKVHPNVMSCLLHLRLKTELTVQDTEADKKRPLSKGKVAEKRAKGKKTEQPHLSKKETKIRRELQGIEEELRDAEAEVDVEERANRQTETLKLLFVLYFGILKQPTRTPLLPAALRGISRYAHLVNIDFFRDLIEVLKQLLSSEVEDPAAWLIVHRLQCIVTAFELLTGQGEVLDIDLDEFTKSLYGLIIPLSTMSTIETPSSAHDPATPADLLFRALSLVFNPNTRSPAYRSAAFAKRLLGASLHFPVSTAVRSLKFVQELLAREPKLGAMLENNGPGRYRPEMDEPQLSGGLDTTWWELAVVHGSREIRDAAGAIRQ